MPALFGVQTERCAPLARAWDGDSGEVSCSGSIAEGILIASPPRMRSVLEAVRETRGSVVAVSEDAIAAATLELARLGIYAEPTAAVAAAAVERAFESTSPGGVVVAAVTATGLKAGTAVESLLDMQPAS
jgi:threonine synthase